MKVITKKINIVALVVVLAVLFTFCMINANTQSIAQADDVGSVPDTSAYFYDNLTDDNGGEYILAKKFYKSLEKMNEENDFLDGVVDYNIGEVATSEQIKDWIENNNLEVPKAFSAARDAFLTDHPELFYIDFYKMTISVAKSGDNYVGFINSGREANLFYENGFNTKADVENAILKFNAAIGKIVDTVNKSEEEDTYSARDVFLAREVNKYLAENVKYDYVAYENKDDPNFTAAAYINTAYGALVENKAVCGGYSTAYKVVMDKLGIPCLTVNGYTKNRDQNGNNAASNVYHMWNYVYLKNSSAQSAVISEAARDAESGRWYSVDVTWDNTANNKYRYAVMNADSDDKIHVNDGVISSSGYQLTYPALSSLNYGSTGETDGLVCSIAYNREGDLKDDNGEPLQCNYKTVSYNGKSAMRLLEEDGLHIVFRDVAYNGGDFEKDLVWTRWTSLAAFIDEMTGGIKDEDFYIQDTGLETRFYDNTSVYATQFAVFDVKPDGVKWYGDTIVNYYYSDEFVNDLTPVEMGELLINQTYGTYTAPPYILSNGRDQAEIISDSMRGADGFITERNAFSYEISYDEPLHILDESKPIGIYFISEHPNTQQYAKFYPNKNGDLVELVEGYENSGSTNKIVNTLRFKFAPSLMYEHNMENYHIYFTNVGSAKEVMRKNETTGKLEKTVSNKVPNPVSLSYCRAVMACPARFNYDGRLWIECCAQPTLITQTDLSEMDFKDENGNSTFSANERSQMLLVAERANTETVDAMLDGINDSNDININSADITASETYDIQLQLCKKYPTISDGSYVKIALGFPEGYGPKDEGVTFKLFHRKHVQGDEYIIEEIPCVVTQFGIVATVTSFSPYMVAVVSADKATDKTVYASIEGKGGTLTKEDGKIISFKEGDSHTYTIQPNEGYMIYSVTLNGNNVLDRVEKGKLTLNYADLNANNELVIQYIANEAAARIQNKLDNNVIDQALEAGKCVIDVKGNVTTNNSMPSYNVNPDDFVKVETNNPKNNTLVIVLVVCLSVLAVAAGVTIAVVVTKKKKANTKKSK